MAVPRRLWLPASRWARVALYTSLLYALCILVMPVDGFWTPDAGAKYLQMLNVRWTGAGFNADVPYPARDVDPEMRLVNMPFSYTYGRDGLFHTYFPLAFAVLSRAAYAVFGLRGLLIWPALGGLAATFLSGLIAERWKAGRGWAAMALTGLATPVIFYSQTFWEHTIALALALAGLYALVWAETAGAAPGVRRLLAPYALALALVAAAGVFRPETLLFEACCLVWCGWRIFVAGGGAPKLAVVAVAVLGAGLFAVVAARSPYARALDAGRMDVQGRILSHLTDPAQRPNIPRDLWERLGDVFYNIPDAGALALAPMRCLTLLALALALAALWAPAPWKPRLVALAAMAAAAPAAVNAFYPDPIRSTHGVILSAPFVLAAVALLRAAAPAKGLVTGTMLTFVAAELLFFNWGTAGGREWGARGILLLYPLAAIVVAAQWPARRAWSLEGLALAILTALSVAVQARGLVQLRSELGLTSSWTRALLMLPPSTVATDVWWLTSSTTPAFYRHRFVMLPAGPGQAQAAEYLRRQPGVDSSGLVFATTCFVGCELPSGLRGYYRVASEQEARGLWLGSVIPR
jgi:hypothetical protein